ncbi:MAG TPA: FAD-dependent oxidoreductase [Dongiaceae bacterium]|nr:FAD-dependent oxidoreductase [Dongiaceae bacterium]
MNSADVLIVGCGIQGATMALCAARRGLRPLVLERDRPASGATGNSFGIVHGGLRYLQSLELARWARSRRQQKWLLDAFPALVRPLACTMPLYRRRLRSPSLFEAAFLTDRALGALVGRHRTLPADRVIRNGAFEGAKIVKQGGLVGAAVWHDAAIADARALVDAILSQAGGGADIVRAHLEVESLILEKGRLAGLRATDLHNGRQVVLAAPTVVLCAGAGSRDLAARLDRDEPRLSSAVLGFNLLLDLDAGLSSAIAVSPDPGRGRSYFLRPTPDGLLAGTFYLPCPVAASTEVPAQAVAEFLGELDRCIPDLRPSKATVRKVMAGLLPDADGTGRTLKSDDFFWDHGKTGGPHSLYTVLGTKLTTAEALSNHAANRIWPGRPASSAMSAHDTFRRNGDAGVAREEAAHGG